MKPVTIRQGRITISFPIEKLPTVNKEVNKIVANQLIERLKVVLLKKNPSVKVLEEFAMIFQNKFPYKWDEYDQIIHQAIKDIKRQL